MRLLTYAVDHSLHAVDRDNIVAVSNESVQLIGPVANAAAQASSDTTELEDLSKSGKLFYFLISMLCLRLSDS